MNASKELGNLRGMLYASLPISAFAFIASLVSGGSESVGLSALCFLVAVAGLAASHRVTGSQELKPDAEPEIADGHGLRTGVAAGPRNAG